MSGSRPPATADRELRFLLVVALACLAAVLLCIGITALYFGQLLGLGDSVREMVRTHQRAERVAARRTGAAGFPSTSGAAEGGAAVPESLCDVHFFFQTEEGLPVSGRALLDRRHRLPESVVTPLVEGGQLSALKVRCSDPWVVQYTAGNGSSWHTFEVPAVADSDTCFVVVDPWMRGDRCPLRVVVESEDGSVPSGRMRLTKADDGKVWQALDEAGGADFPDAPCRESQAVWLQLDEGPTLQVDLSRVPDHLPEVRLSLAARAEVRVVDEAGQRCEEASLRVRGSRHSPRLRSDVKVEEVGPGQFVLVGPGATAPAAIVVDGRILLEEIPLDGGTHEVVFRGHRSVEVHLPGAGDVQSVACGLWDCEGSAGGEGRRWQCGCPAPTAPLVVSYEEEHGRAPELVGVVPEGVDFFEAELGVERAAIRLEKPWHPDRRLRTFLLHRTTPEGMPLEAGEEGQAAVRLVARGNALEKRHLLPGHYLLTWQVHTRTGPDQPWQTTTEELPIVLEPGEERDLGRL